MTTLLTPLEWLLMASPIREIDAPGVHRLSERIHIVARGNLSWAFSNDSNDWTPCRNCSCSRRLQRYTNTSEYVRHAFRVDVCSDAPAIEYYVDTSFNYRHYDVEREDYNTESSPKGNHFSINVCNIYDIQSILTVQLIHKWRSTSFNWHINKNRPVGSSLK